MARIGVKLNHVLLLTPVKGDLLASLLRVLDAYHVIVIRAKADLVEKATHYDNAPIIAYGSGVIVPASLLRDHKGPAYNFHAGSPEFPGRDPHHFAVYEGAVEFGATAHVMVDKIDSGPILGVERFSVARDASPDFLLSRANEAMFRLFQCLAEPMASGGSLEPVTNEVWSSTYGTRAKFHKMAHVSVLMDNSETARRVRAFGMSGYRNLTTRVGNHTFKLELDETAVEDTSGGPYAEFTESGYRELIKMAKAAGYRFVFYDDDPIEERSALWRHDIDFSVHRALALARIEKSEGVSSTFFVNPKCAYYNVFEPAIAGKLVDIAAMGHRIGLHFDASAPAGACETRDSLQQALRFEKQLLEDQLQLSVDAVSWHNPDVGQLLDFDDDVLGGMINCYGRSFKEGFEYVSDSNGIWRFTSAFDVVQRGHQRLHVLTHPGWWVPEPMSPHARIERCLLGRARAVMAEYDTFLAQQGRPNLGHLS